MSCGLPQTVVYCVWVQSAGKYRLCSEQKPPIFFGGRTEFLATTDRMECGGKSPTITWSFSPFGMRAPSRRKLCAWKRGSRPQCGTETCGLQPGLHRSSKFFCRTRLPGRGESSRRFERWIKFPPLSFWRKPFRMYIFAENFSIQESFLFPLLISDTADFALILPAQAPVLRFELYPAARRGARMTSFFGEVAGEQPATRKGCSDCWDWE